MENMKCFQCLYKHLACALSYSKEIIAGHNQTHYLNHKIDFLGQLVNAEHHLQMIDQSLFNKLAVFRRDLQGRSLDVTQTDMDTIRQIYSQINDLEKRNSKTPESIRQRYSTTKYRTQDKYTVIYDGIKDIDRFKKSYELLRLNVVNDLQVIVCASPDVDLSEFPQITAVDTDLYSLLAEDQTITDNFVYMKDSYFIIKTYDFNFLFSSYTQKRAKDQGKIRQAGAKRFCYSWDSGKPQIINRQKYLEVMKDFQTEDVLSAYFNLTGTKPQFNNIYNTVILDKKLCCSNKSKIAVCSFVQAVNQEGFNSLVQWLNKID